MPSLGGAASGALTGAKFGSFIPGIGTGIGAAIGGIAGLFGFGHGKKEPEQNPEDPYLKLLTDQSAAQRTNAKELGGEGESAIAPTLHYLRSLLSENPADLNAATRPERKRVIDQYDTARKAIATFSPRGGGATSASAQSQFDQAESLADITSNARRDAASALGNLGTSLTGLSLSADQLASADLNTVINAVLNRDKINTDKRGQTMEMWGGIGKAAGTILGDILFKKDKE